MMVFDTDVLSFLMRAAPPAALVRRVNDVPPEQHATTAVNVGELVYGACRSERREALLAGLERLVSNVAVLPFDRAAAERYGRVRAELERRHLTVAEPDLRIAAICLAHDAELATGNLRHFERVPGLKVKDWLADVRPPARS
jgi:predicted nucleic acid-binding protein